VEQEEEEEEEEVRGRRDPSLSLYISLSPALLSPPPLSSPGSR